MSGVLIGALVVSAAIALWSVISLYRSRRYMSSFLVLVTAILIAIYGTDVVARSGAPTKSVMYFGYSLGFLALFVTLYPAIPKDEWRERLRMYFLVAVVGFSVVVGKAFLDDAGIPVLLLSLILITAVMLSYTLGTMCTNGMKSKKRRRRCGVHYPTWGAVSVSHLLFYPAIAIILAAPSYCTDAVLLGILACVSFVLAALASMGVRSEGNYWETVDKKPRSLIGSSAYFVPAFRNPPGPRRLV